MNRISLSVLCLILLITGVVTSGLGECSRQCPDGWTYFQDSCYLFVDDRNLAWKDAKVHCSLSDANLVSINSLDEDVFLQRFTRRLFRNGNDRKNVAFWTGGNDVEFEAEWKWDGSNVMMTYTNWYPGQPDTHNDSSEDCLMLYGYNDFTWHDVPCNFPLYPICELSVGQEENVLEIIG